MGVLIDGMLFSFLNDKEGNDDNILLLHCVQKLQIVLAECEKRKEEVWITKDFSVAAQVMWK